MRVAQLVTACHMHCMHANTSACLFHSRHAIVRPCALVPLCSLRLCSCLSMHRTHHLVFRPWPTLTSSTLRSGCKQWSAPGARHCKWFSHMPHPNPHAAPTAHAHNTRRAHVVFKSATCLVGPQDRPHCLQHAPSAVCASAASATAVVAALATFPPLLLILLLPSCGFIGTWRVR